VIDVITSACFNIRSVAAIIANALVVSAAIARLLGFAQSLGGWPSPMPWCRFNELAFHT
jgi:hypothetical protein